MTAAFFVEGRLEQRAIQRICPGSPVRVIGANGRDCALEAIVKRIESLLKLLGNRHHPIFIIFDRECREESSETIEALIIHQLNELGFGPDQFIVGVPDRHIENWILPHISKDGNFDNIPADDTVVDGTFGKGELRERLEAASISYHETTIGTDLFCRIRPNIVCLLSPSFNRFRQRARAHCNWLRL